MGVKKNQGLFGFGEMHGAVSTHTEVVIENEGETEDEYEGVVWVY